ncbi:MAG TPA: S8 family peptidase, partial [Ardenticatenaceae bacterium]|nr:S8 family peptidase [Ardenticatenaceae bacterium]
GRAADSVQGPNGTYADVGAARLSFVGFSAEMTPGYAISKVELVLSAYVSDRLRGNERLVVGVTAAGTSGQTVSLGHRDVGALGGVGNAGALYLDITSTRRWQWADFDDSLTVTIDQQSLRKGGSIAYDALGLRVTSVPGVDTSGGVQPTALPRGATDASRLQTNYHRAVRAPDVWNQAPAYLQGQGMTVAVVDSGFIKNRDLGGRLLARVNFEKSSHKSEDRYGHGTHVISILAGSGVDSRGQYMGIAPKANVISLRIANDEGMSTESDVVAALQWIYENRTRYNIRVVNLSLNSSEAQSYHTSPLNAAVEVLWFSGIVVVVSAGNNGSGANSAHLYPPANDPFVITVGATDDRGTPQLADDVVAPFSASGTTPDGLAKPELVAPGANIVAYLPENNRLKISRDHPGHRISTDYFRMSGTSMAAPMVSAAAVLLLQDEPGLTPDQVKYRLMATAARAESWPGYDAPRAGAGYVDVYAAVNGSTTESANSGATPSQLLWSDGTPPAWGSVHWGSVHWGSVHWGSVHWGSDYWGE